MTNVLRLISLALIIFIGYANAYNRRLFKDFKLKQKEYSILSNGSSAQGQDHNIICQSAKCEYKSNTIYNVTNPDCGNHYTCQECPASFGNDICYLGITSEDWVNVTEGHVELTKHDRMYNQAADKGRDNGGEIKGYEDEYDEDEDAFIEVNDDGISFVHKFISSQTFSYVDHNNDKWLSDNKRLCQVDSEGNLELSLRLIFQYYRSPMEASTGQVNQPQMPSYRQSGDSMLQLSSTTTTTNSSSGGESLLELTQTSTQSQGLGGGLAFFGRKKYADDDGDDDEESSNAFSEAAKKGLNFSMSKGGALKTKISNAIKFLYEKAQVMMSKSEIHIHFVVDDIRIKNCRQPLSWSGEMGPGALIFVGNQNFKLKAEALNTDFLKRAIRVNASVRGIYELAFNSCVQVHCTRRVVNKLVINNRRSILDQEGFGISRRFMNYFNLTPNNTSSGSGAPVLTSAGNVATNGNGMGVAHYLITSQPVVAMNGTGNSTNALIKPHGPPDLTSTSGNSGNRSVLVPVSTSTPTAVGSGGVNSTTTTTNSTTSGSSSVGGDVPAVDSTSAGAVTNTTGTVGEEGGFWANFAEVLSRNRFWILVAVATTLVALVAIYYLTK